MISLLPARSIIYSKKDDNNIFKKMFRNISIAGASLLFAFFSTYSVVKAQISQSPFTYDTETYSTFFDGQILGNQNNDDIPFTGISIGFDFVFNGFTYQEVSISPNGYIVLGNSTSTATAPISNLNNVISGMGGDLAERSSTNSSLRYKSTGLAPERVFTVQWTEYTSKPTMNDNINFQIRLFESSNSIQFHYGTAFLNWFSPDFYVQVGLRGNSASDFHTRVAYGTDDWRNTTEGNSKDDYMVLLNLITPSNGLHSGTRYTFSVPVDPQPVQLYSFAGAFEDNSIKLKWTTATELNNDYFQIERSVDGVDFEVITQLKGAGNSNHLVNYEYIDRAIQQNKYFYRLRQVDYNGASETFNMIVVENKSFLPSLSFAVFPNPATKDNLRFTVNSPDREGDVSVVLYSIEGKVLFSRSYSGREIESEMSLDHISELAPKTYYLKIVQGRYQSIKPVVIIQ